MTIHIAKLVGLIAFTCVSAHAAELTVNVTDIRNERGTVKVIVVDSEAGMKSETKPVAMQGAKPSAATATFHIDNLAPGPYAVTVIHDENDNGKLDTNFMGMPIEGYGFSNNPAVLRRAHYDEARFELGAAGGSVDIRLR